MRLSDIGAWYGRVAAALLVLWCAASVAASTPDRSDVRILIDISGSMRQNDPNNLRRPALRMLAGLLQPGTKAGVWTFARWTDNLVPVGDVDSAWKKRTQSVSEKISSPGQFTNIEDVLDKSSADWSGEPTTHARHLVLLTDGMVDVSKQAAENAQSRERIIGTLLPRLKAAGVKVHTIALSERADHALMKTLAGETGGWYQQVAQADELQRAFLRMFETVGKPDSVPLQDNRFVVDSSISEATVLVFSKPDAPPVVLRSPSGDEYTDSDLPAGVAWFRDQGYDLITVASPQKGEWRLQADIDPDNRVMIVTDLKLQHSEVPTHMAVGESLRIEAKLSSRGELVTRQAFLRLLQVHAERVDQDGSQPLALNDQGEGIDDKAADGRYTLLVSEPDVQDEVGVLVAVESPTFMRQKRFRLAVHEPAEGSVADGPDGPVLNITLQGAVMQPGAQLSAWQLAADGQRMPLQLAESQPGQWSASLMDPVLPSYLKVSGTTKLGNLIERTAGPIVPPGVTAPAVVAAPPVVDAPPPVAVVPPPPPVEPEATAPPAEPAPVVPPAVEEDSLLLPGLVFGGFNLTLMIGAGLWFFLRRRRAAADDELEFDDLVDDIDASPEEQTSLQEDAA